MRTHGVRSTYTQGGCRCDECKAAHNEFQRRYFKRQRAAVHKLAAISELHQPDGPACTCGTTWPCPTRRTLDKED